MAQYDLTPKVAKFLDRHLVLPLLDFLSNQEAPIFDPKDLLKARVQLLSKTNMVDFHEELHKLLHESDDAPEAFEARRKAVLEKVSHLKVEAKPVIDALEAISDEKKNQLITEKRFTSQYLKETSKITEEQVDVLFTYAKFQFDCGSYPGASLLISNYLPLVSTATGAGASKYLSALWGKFATDILVGQWEQACNDLEDLKNCIDSNNYGTPLEKLQQRGWLVHWSLFVFFMGRSPGALELFFQSQYLSAIQNTCPHMLRYVTAAVITSTTKRKGNAVKDLVRVLQHEKENGYKDPITELIECLFAHFDFEGAQQKLRECEEVLKNDPFLSNWQGEFMENARLLIFETYCRIHKVIDIGMLSEKLNMGPERAEQWIVDLIRNARLDAKIDSAKGHVVMTTKYPTIYEQVIDKTRSLTYQTNMFAAQVAQPASS
eukprot:TRINITY_DN8543_c0_g1_i1.p1 TRINITY_DN8543_c0_g1~~TRINITY_DN8543_c0_g1_i1.p1  ORF type:complete len:433 (-),score=120.13 TRINITY_DN8543_c0_g1_i1:43-1341(-)